METMQKNMLTEQEAATDLLNTQKFMTGVYNTYYCEAATPELKNCISRILADEHQIHEKVFDEMRAHGWYVLEKAEDAKLNSTRQKFSKSVHA